MAASNCNGKPRAVLYLRRSTGKQEMSIPAQRAELTKYARQRSYTIVREYVDTKSGDATEERTAFLEMRDAVGTDEFSIVLVWSQCRFGRFDPLDAGHWIYPFRRAGVQLETVDAGPIDWEDLTSQLVYSVNQLGKAQFLRDLSRNTTRGLLSRAKEGKAGTGGPNPFGYKSKDGEVWIVPEEAEIVRKIFSDYLKPDGSIRSIAADLNRRKIRSPRGNGWRSSSVESILKRQKYTGSFVYGSRNAGKYYSFRDGEIVPRRKTEKEARSEPIVIADKFEAIIDQETFDRTRAKLESRKGKTAKRTARQYVLSGLLKCGDCGGALGGRTNNNRTYYRCIKYHSSGRQQCFCNSIHEGPLLATIVRLVQERYTAKAARERLRQTLKQEQETGRPRPKDLARLRREIESLERKISNGEEATIEAPPALRPGLYRKLEELMTERDRIKAELEALTSEETRSDRLSDAEIDQAVDVLRELGEALAKARPEETKELLGAMISRIELRFDHGKRGSQNTSTFTDGEIFLRPEIGEGRWTDPRSTMLSKNRSFLGHDGKSIRFTAEDLRRAA